MDSARERLRYVLETVALEAGHLQDTAGDKLLHAVLICLGEPVGSALDNLNRAASLGLLAATSDDWIAARRAPTKARRKAWPPAQRHREGSLRWRPHCAPQHALI